MGKKKALSNAEKQRISDLLVEGTTIKDIAELLQRDIRTVKKHLADVNGTRKKRSDAGIRKLNNRELRNITRVLKKMPLATSKAIFNEAGVVRNNRMTRYNILNDVAKVVKAVKTPPLSKKNIKKRVEWAEKYLKCDFSKVLFTDECRATLDGPDGFCRGWLADGSIRPRRFRRQQGGGGVMFWAGIVGETLVGPFFVEEGVKMTSANYVKFLQDHFLPWFNRKSKSFKNNLVFMQDNAPSHAAKCTIAFLERKGFKGKRFMLWPAQSPDLNCIENLWGTVKQRLYTGGKQYTSKGELQQAIVNILTSIEPSLIKKLTNSMDSRLIKIMSSKGHYINM